MSHPDPSPPGPSLPAIRERLQAEQARLDAPGEWDWAKDDVAPILADLAAVLEEHDRLEARVAELRAALTNVAEVCEDDGVSRCWCDIEHRCQMREQSAIPHRDFCLAARAALGEE